MRGQSAILRAIRLEFGEHGQPDRDVDGLAQQVEQMVGQPQPDGQLRVACLEPRQERGQDPAGEAQGRGDPQVAVRRAAGIGDDALGVRHRRQHLLAGLVERGALLGRLDLAGGAVEQPDAEMALELLQPVADHGRRQAQVPPGGRQAAELDHPDEHLHVLDQHPHRQPPSRPIVCFRLKILGGGSRFTPAAAAG